jgi:hypothetical protein
VLAGKVLRNPSFATIEPLLPLLGEKQAPAEDEDERVAADGELLTTAEDEKAAAKAAKSEAIYRECRDALMTGKTLVDLGAVADRIKKDKRYLLENHLTALRDLHADKKQEINKVEAKEVA